MIDTPYYFKEDYTENCHIISFSPHKKNTFLIKKLQKFLLFSLRSSDDKLKENYSSKNFNLQEQNLISIIQQNNLIKSFSTVFNRKFYGNKIFRVYNRTYISTDFRTNYFYISSKKTLTIIEHQFNYAKSFGADHIFISKQGNSKKIMKRIELEFSNYFNVKWHAHDKKLLVCPNKNDPACYQWVVSHSYNQNKFALKGWSKAISSNIS